MTACSLTQEQKDEFIRGFTDEFSYCLPQEDSEECFCDGFPHLMPWDEDFEESDYWDPSCPAYENGINWFDECHGEIFEYMQCLSD